MIGNRTDTQLNLSMSMPIGREVRSPTLSSGFSHIQQGSHNLYTGVTGTAGEYNQFGYGVSANRHSNGDKNSNTGNANVQYNNSIANLTASTSIGDGYQQISFGVAGAAIIHPGGVTLAQSLGETIGIVEAPDATGAAVTNVNAVRVNRSGYAVVPHLTPYQINTIDLDPKDIPTDVELKASTQSVAPRAGSVVMLKYETISGRAMLVNATQADGKPLPFGASVFDLDGNNVGVVGQGSRIFARGMADVGVINIKWGYAEDQQCAIHYALPPKVQGRQQTHDQFDANCLAMVETSTVVQP